MGIYEIFGKTGEIWDFLKDLVLYAMDSFKLKKIKIKSRNLEPKQPNLKKKREKKENQNLV